MLKPTLEAFRHIGCTNDRDRLTVIRLPMRRVAGSWTSLQVRWVPETRDRPICDYPNFAIKLEAYSRRAADALRPFLVDNGELLKLRGLNDRYIGYHLLSVSDALNKSRSDISYDRIDKVVSQIWKAVFKKPKLEGFSMFRVRGNYSHVFVQRPFVDVVEEAGLTGFCFTECEVR